jgi:hypothetical protein
MNKLKQNVQVLIEVCEHYEKVPEEREKLRKQILYLLAAINKQVKEQDVK